MSAAIEIPALDRVVVPRVEFERRFWSHTRVGIQLARMDAPCVEWHGERYRNGYGCVLLSSKPRRRALAHRVAFELAHGPIPGQMLVCHRCDNPSCIRVEHLFLGTHADNSRDASAKGRTKHSAEWFDAQPARVQRGDAHWTRRAPSRVARGERAGAAKMCPETVVQARERFAAGGATISALAREYGLSLTAMFHLLRGNHWKHVGGPTLPVKR